MFRFTMLPELNLWSCSQFSKNFKEPGLAGLIPNYELQLKVGTICIFTRNLCVRKSLVKNARVVVKSLQCNYPPLWKWVHASRIELPHIMHNIWISTTECQFYYPPEQYSLQLAYATIFNSCQESCSWPENWSICTWPTVYSSYMDSLSKWQHNFISRWP